MTQRRLASVLAPLAASAALVITGTIGGTFQSHAAAPAVQPVIPLQARPFALTDVRLLDGPFLHAMELNRAYVLSLDVDRLLHNFRVNAGLPSSAKPYGGWEEPKCELRGHFVGHYLSACALLYASTGDARLKAKGDAVVAGLAECQARLNSGYLSAYPETFIDRVEARAQVWAPYYTLHKLYAGLLDMAMHCASAQALEVCKKFADWAITRNARLTDDQMEAMLGNEHGGMNESLANLYALTGEENYLKIAQRFNHRTVLGPASQREDKLTGLHANTQIPKFVGAARQYELTGQAWLRTASMFFWDTVVQERSYVIGGHSDGEMFSPKEKLSEALGPNTTETCNTYNMLKLTRHLFCWDPQAHYADYYERALLNHILASQNPENGMTCYYVPLRSGSRKTYCDAERSFWCCTGTGVENHAQYGDSIYFHDGDGLFVNLFIASELTWKAKGLKLSQRTRYPADPSTTLHFTSEQPIRLELRLRHPAWAEQGIRVAVNGQPVSVTSQPGSYAKLAREWHSGDVVELVLPMTLRAEGFRDNPRRLALLHGPVVLSAEVDSKKPFPALVAEEGRLLASLKPVAGKPSTFTGSGEVFRIAGEANRRDVVLEPFYQMHGSRHYVVYWDTFSPEQWRAKEADYLAALAAQRELQARAVDTVQPGEEQDERDHQLLGERTSAGDFSGRKWRHATDGGWFSWVVKVLPDQPQELRVTYWGGDGGNRVFDVLIDGVKLATQRLQNNRPGKFYDETHALPPEMTRGKARLTVKFQAHPGAFAGGVFGVRVLKPLPKSSAAERGSANVVPAGQRDVTFILTSDSHYDAFENEDRNERVRDTLREINAVTNRAWPEVLGGGRIARPWGVLLLGDVIDDGDRMLEGKRQAPRQWAFFEADFGLDGTEGLLNFPVFETWGNHDGPPVGHEQFGFSVQARLKQRNARRQQQRLVTAVSTNGLHYSWDWADVHFVQLGLYPADRVHPLMKKYGPPAYDPQGALTFLKEDLARHVGDSGRPVVLSSHCGFDTDRWHTNDWQAAYEVMRPYNVVLYAYGHTGTGLRDWAPPAERTLRCVNTGQTENGFFIVQITDDRVRLAFRAKQWQQEPAPEGKTRKTWNGQWTWLHQSMMLAPAGLISQRATKAVTAREG